MSLTSGAYKELTPDKYPLSAKYDPQWVIDNTMGPHPLWLAESLTSEMELRPGMKVLDLGCGKALTSIFLTQEYGVQVWAAELWVEPSENLERIRAAGLEDHVFPLRADAHALPFAADFFDAIVSFDAYHYFGTDLLYLSYLQKFARKGGQIGMVSPSFPAYETDDPGYIMEDWQGSHDIFHSPRWWKELWQSTDTVDITLSDMAPGGIDDWLTWNGVFLDLGLGPTDVLKREAMTLEDQRERGGGFVRLLAVKKGDL